jgi:hypothetical protein
MLISPKYYVTWGCHISSVTMGYAFSHPICLVALLVAKKPIAPSGVQCPVHADQFDVPHDPLELLHVPLLVHVVHGSHGVHGLHPDQPNALLSASRTTSCSC